MQSAAAGPYLSIVVACEDASRGATTRAKRFMHSWKQQTRRFRLASELIVVTSTAPGALSDLFYSPADEPACETRLIEVRPESLVRRKAEAPRRYLRRVLQNIGIRRARGEFILATNIDVLLSNEVVQFLAARRLEHGRMYRIDTYGVEGQTQDSAVDDQLAYCHSHVVRLFAREGTFALTPQGLRNNFSTDISSFRSEVTFGSGWFPPEPHPRTGETIRWMNGRAEILARVPDGGGTLTLEIEPGPGVQGLPQTIQLFDETESKIACWSFDSRTTMSLLVPAREGGQLKRFQVRLSDSGAPLLDDPRILDLAVFRCDWVDPNVSPCMPPSLISSFRENSGPLRRLLANLESDHRLAGWMRKAPAVMTRAARLLARRANDIFQSGMDFQLGPGWYYREESGAERFRWVSKDASALLRMPQGASGLAMLVEPGPQHPSFTLVVRSPDQHGDLLATIPVRGLTYFEFPAPAAPGTIAPLYITADPAALPGREDPRVLSFRVFAFGAGTKAHNPCASYCDWLALAVDSKPVGKDWIAALQPVRGEIAQLGKPDYLHTNRCGDFILMSRKHWLDIRGFGEVDLPSGYADSLLCYTAHHAGAREEMLQDPLRVYHLDDDSAPEPTLSREWDAALRDDLIWLIRQMRALEAPVIFNTEHWGGASET